MHHCYLKLFSAFAFTVTLTACVSIPPEAPELSVELGNRISALENSNITLLHRFFDQKRNDLDIFITEEWVPAFAKEVFSNPKIATAWNTIVKEKNKHQRLTFIIKMGPKLQKMINVKRVELMQPLDDLERKIETRLRSEYSQARSINNSITSFLLSSSKVTKSRNRYLEMAGLKNDKIGKLISKTDDAVTDLIKNSKKTLSGSDSAEQYLNTIRTIRDSF